MNQIHLESFNGNLARAFPAIVRLCLKQTSRGDHHRQLKILTRRHGLDGAPINTLEELGAVYDLTRERIRQIQAKAEQRISQLLEGSLKRRGWDICPSLRSACPDLKDDLASAGPALSRTRFQSVVRKRFGNGVKGHWFSLFAQILGYGQLAPSGKVQIAELNELWVPQDLAPQKSIDAAFRTLSVLRKSPEGAPLTTLLAELRSVGHTRIDEPLLRAVIKALPRLQVTRSELVRVRAEWLNSAADQAWRVLIHETRALSRHEIARRVNALRVGKRQLKPMPIESIATQMSGDDRFVCSGKSGLWGLEEWGTLSEITIVEAMEMALHIASQPLTMNALIRATTRLRPDASPWSIKSYVSQRPNLFVSAGRKKVALTAWNLGLPQLKRRKKVRCDTADFLAAIELAREGRDRMPLTNLVERIVDLTDVAAVTARQRLKVLRGVHMEAWPGHRGKLVSFSAEISCPANERPTTREKLQKTIRTLLEDEGIVFERKKDLYEKVNRRLPCERSTFYRYLSEMSDLSTNSNAGR